jgi:hypothetical protein
LELDYVTILDVFKFHLLNLINSQRELPMKQVIQVERRRIKCCNGSRTPKARGGGEKVKELEKE